MREMDMNSKVTTTGPMQITRMILVGREVYVGPWFFYNFHLFNKKFHSFCKKSTFFIIFKYFFFLLIIRRHFRSDESGPCHYSFVSFFNFSFEIFVNLETCCIFKMIRKSLEWNFSIKTILLPKWASQAFILKRLDDAQLNSLFDSPLKLKFINLPVVSNYYSFCLPSFLLQFGFGWVSDIKMWLLFFLRIIGYLHVLVELDSRCRSLLH